MRAINNFRNCKTDKQKVLFVYNMSYLRILKNFEELGDIVLNYFNSQFRLYYDELLRYLVTARSVQFSCLRGILKLEGEGFVKALIKKYSECGNIESNIFNALYKVQDKNKNLALIWFIKTLKIFVKLLEKNLNYLISRRCKSFCNSYVKVPQQTAQFSLISEGDKTLSKKQTYFICAPRKFNEKCPLIVRCKVKLENGVL